MLTLYKYVPAWGLPDLSPFVVKLETYLRIAKIPYEGRLGDPRKAPKRKIPYIENDGHRIGDSSLAIEHLEKVLGKALDAHLTPKERALGTAFKSMIEEHLYFVIVYQRWQLDDGWAIYTPVMRDVLKSAGVPGPLRGLLLRQIRGGMVKALHGQGLGRHSPDEINRIGTSLIASISDFMGDDGGPFFLGAQPSSFDATVYAFLTSLMDAPFPSQVKDEANRRRNLRAYVDRIKAEYWSQ